MNTLTTDFYLDFSCKCGSCRHACCIGWPVNVTMDEYFRLLGVECSDELRRRLDCGMILRGGGEAEYAYIHHGFTGDCYMRRDDGLCAIQRELGEEILPAICRMYPRSSTAWDDGAKCAVANSCEETLELLFHREKPIEFITSDISLPTVKRSGSREGSLKYALMLQNRFLPLKNRIAEIVHCGVGSDESKTYNAALLLLSLGERSRNAHDICLQAKSTFASPQAFCDAMKSAGEKEELLFEQLLVNHVFFSDLTSPDSPEPAAVYLLMKSLYCGTRHETEAEAVDMLSEAFRFIEHSPFASVVSALHKKGEISIPDLLGI